MQMLSSSFAAKLRCAKARILYNSFPEIACATNDQSPHRFFAKGMRSAIIVRRREVAAPDLWSCGVVEISVQEMKRVLRQAVKSAKKHQPLVD